MYSRPIDRISRLISDLIVSFSRFVSSFKLDSSILSSVAVIVRIGGV